jgi:hypothetical protein
VDDDTSTAELGGAALLEDDAPAEELGGARLVAASAGPVPPSGSPPGVGHAASAAHPRTSQRETRRDRRCMPSS